MFKQYTTNEDLAQLLQVKSSRPWRPNHSVIRLQDLKPPEIPECLYQDPTIVKEPPPAKVKKGNEWLKSKFKEFESRIPGLSWENFSQSLIQLLLSGHSNERLQNELAELLGFEAFELILEVLQDREQIVEDFVGDKQNSDVTEIPADTWMEVQDVIKTYELWVLL